MVAVAWTAICLLAATLVGSLFYLGSRIDHLGDSLIARIDSLDARLSARIDALSAKMDTHLERHAG